MSGIVGSFFNHRGSGLVANLGTDGHSFNSGGAGVKAVTEAAAAAGVDTSGTPANNQLAIFTDADTVEGSSNVVYDGTNMTLTGGNLIIGTAGKGIDFSAQTQTAATGATAVANGEVLDHYEEGTWTPTLVAATPGDPTFTVSNYDPFYTRIGNRVFLSVNFYKRGDGATPTGTSGALTLGALPFASMVTGTNYGFIDLHFWTAFHAVSNAVQITFINYDGTSTMDAIKVQDDADGYMNLWTPLVFSDLGGWSHFSGLGQYMTET